jgi:membrane-anchored protein YejM (alkaline phosphatase superfamily)
MWSYYTMKAINDMTKVNEGSTNNFVYFGTDMTHDTEFLQEPEYEPRDVVDNTKYGKTHTTRFLYKSEMMWIHDAKDFRHYPCNLATLVAIGKWLDHLKEIGCYDNTRIIIVSDHGYYIENFVNLLQYDIGAKLDGEAFAPLLMVKDFGAHGKIQTSEEFMTTADTPYLATKDVISNPVNPYTGKPITDQGKANGITVFDSDKWKVQINNGTAYLAGDWYSLKDSIWKKENWKYLGNY